MKEKPVSRFTLKLTYEYDGAGSLQLAAARRVKMVPPPANSPRDDNMSERSGFWYEARGISDEVLYRRVIEHPVQTCVEVPAEESHAVTHCDARTAHGEFTLLLPDLENTRYVVLIASTPGEKPDAARELIRSDVKEILQRTAE